MKSSEEGELTLLSNLRQLLNLLTSESTPRVKIFRPRWSLINDKLIALQNLLSQLSLPTHVNNPLVADVLRSISATISTAESLSSACQCSSPPAGKLRTQNDVNSLSSALDGHINDLEVILRSRDDSRNDVASDRGDSVKAEARNLMTRLQIGSVESKNSTLESLLGLLQEDDKSLLIAVAQGIVPVLVKLLDSSSSSEVKEKTVAAIARISTCDSSKHILLAEGLVLLNNLLRVLESGTIFAKEKSCVALLTMSISKENARAIASRGGVASLLDICREGTPSSQALAAAVLRNLAVFEEIKDTFIEENAVMTLLRLCDSGTTSAQVNSIGCLCNLVRDDDHLKMLVAREGGVERVKNLWDNSSSDVQSLEVAVRMTRRLATCPNVAEFLVENGFLGRVIGALNCGSPSVRIEAANSLCDFAYSNKTRKELGEMGCVSLLVRMLDVKANVEEKDAAVKALSAVMMDCESNRRLFRKEEKGIVCVVQLLDPLVKNLEKKYAVSVLGSLAQSKNCRKQIISAGACVHLQKLVDSDDVEGCKKLLDSLRRGKLWGVSRRH